MTLLPRIRIHWHSLLSWKSVSASIPLALACLVFVWPNAPSSYGAVVKLENGRVLEGRAGKLSSMLQNPFEKQSNGTNANLRLIGFVTDDIRRTYFCSYQVADLSESVPQAVERFRIDQRVAQSGKAVGSVGSILGVTPFDRFGRRIFSMNVQGRGRVDIIQGITEITPRWTKVEGLIAAQPIVWDMRMATTSLPKDVLTAILMQHLDANAVNDRLRIVRFYTQAERYEDARAELQAAIREFPELHELKKEERALRQLSAVQAIREIQRRQRAGQYELVWNLLSNFPDEQVAQETLLRVQQLLDDFTTKRAEAERVLNLLDGHTKQIEDPAVQEGLKLIRAEIATSLDMNTLPRFNSYLRFADDKALAPEQKLAIGISAWVAGSAANVQNLSVAVSLYEVRDLVIQYLRSTEAAERKEILDQIRSLEGGTPAHVARIIAHMAPPLQQEEKAESENAEATTNDHPPRLQTLNVPGLIGHADIRYHVQLPPEYNPTRRYPAVLTLHSASTTAKHQIDWWAGGYHEQTGRRQGQATRHGYIVIAPDWTGKYQSKYEYSGREHAAVLFALRDACKRFSIDTDRVFLSGHSMGGDAAWDIGLAHPDLWAGVIPIVATSDKYVSRYWKNGRRLPMYFVTGELDRNRLERNIRDFDRYLTKQNFDVLITQYIGRGHEHFQDEIQRIFEWMSLQRRDFSPEEFEFYSMRSFDNFGWWVEIDQIPPKALVVPVRWPPKNGVRPIVTSGSQRGTNHLRIKTGAGRVTIWLSPDNIDFSQPISVTFRGKTYSKLRDAGPSLEVLLEDVRTRGDRQHPFWEKLEFPR